MNRMSKVETDRKLYISGGTSMINNTHPMIGNNPEALNNQRENHLTPLPNENASVLPNQASNADVAAACANNYNQMIEAIKTTGVWLVGWTIFSAIDRNIPWAIALAIISLMTFYFSDVAAMFLVFGGVMLWAAIWNIFLSGDFVWIGMGLVQVVFTLIAIRDYRKYRNTKALYGSAMDHTGPSTLPHRESRMAWLALLLGGVILIGLISLIPLGIAMNYVNSSAFDELVITVFLVIMEVGVLGVPVGAAALVAGCQPKAAAAVGIGLGVLSALLSIADVLLAPMV